MHMLDSEDARLHSHRGIDFDADQGVDPLERGVAYSEVSSCSLLLTT